MGHAGAIVTPGLETGTFESKRRALEEAGVTVVNSQTDLIDTVREALKGKTYFKPERYYETMRQIWEAPPPKPSWGTVITKVEPNHLVVRGYPLTEIIEHASLVEAASLITGGELPDEKLRKSLDNLACSAASETVPDLPAFPDEDISRALARHLVSDERLIAFEGSEPEKQVEKCVYALGRMLAYMGSILKTGGSTGDDGSKTGLSEALYRILSGRPSSDKNPARMVEAMVVASIDHGVTPPSAQATLIAASVRATYETAVSHGVGAITDVHGGAGEKAARFFSECVRRAKEKQLSIEDATRQTMDAYVKSGRRIEGMGHRVHTEDPRRNVLWKLAEETGAAGECVAVSKIAGPILEEVRGIKLPINVDGVIGAIVADMGLDPKLAKAIFVLGRVCGLSAHYFEEIATQPAMRRIVFGQAEYKGVPERPFPK
jgi:citrate synthase